MGFTVHPSQIAAELLDFSARIRPLRERAARLRSTTEAILGELRECEARRRLAIRSKDTKAIAETAREITGLAARHAEQVKELQEIGQEIAAAVEKYQELTYHVQNQPPGAASEKGVTPDG